VTKQQVQLFSDFFNIIALFISSGCIIINVILSLARLDVYQFRCCPKLSKPTKTLFGLQF